MGSIQTLVIVLWCLSLCLVTVHTSSSGGQGRSYSYDLSNQSDLRALYNSQVFLANLMKRPLDHMSSEFGLLSHSGVRVTLEDGTQWLVHKGRGFGISSQTVVVDAHHMSSAWRIVKTQNFQGSKTVSDFVKAGGSDYSLIFDNCHLGARRMMKQ